MAAITITRRFNDNFGLDPISIVGVHTPLSLYFDFDRGAISGSYAEVVINGYAFKAVKTLTVGNVDSYVLDGSCLKYLLSFPTLTANTLYLQPTVVINGYNSSGSIIATATHSSFKICHAISDNKMLGLAVLATEGRTKKIYYTDGTYYYYSPTYKEYLTKTATTYTGTISINGATLNVYYVPFFTNGIIVYWLNSDGCFDNFVFTLVSKKRISSKSGESSLYASNLEDYVADTINYKNEITETITLRTIAIDTEHYEQLIQLATSLCIYIDNELWEFDNGNDTFSPCKQNLNFTFSLKRKTHAQSY